MIPGFVAKTTGFLFLVAGITALLGARKVPFSEVSAHRATLEEAYLELTRDAVEYRAEPVRGAA